MAMFPAQDPGLMQLLPQQGADPMAGMAPPAPMGAEPGEGIEVELAQTIVESAMSGELDLDLFIQALMEFASQAEAPAPAAPMAPPMGGGMPPMMGGF